MRKKLPIFISATALLCGLLLAACAPQPAAAAPVRIVMSAVAAGGGSGANYYHRWLEAQTGLDISMELVDPDYMPEYLRLLFLSGEAGVDAVFFAPQDGVTPPLVQAYGKNGDILELGRLVENGAAPNLQALFATHTEYDLEAVLADGEGRLYYMPNLNTSTARRNTQTLWMNTAWLKETQMTIPLTTGDFTQVLRAFANKNAALGGQGGVPVAASVEDAQFIVHYLMNAFVYTDPQNAYLAVEGGRVFFAPATQEWRQGLLYCRELYRQGLLPQLCFTFTQRQFVRLVNDPRDLVGAFTAASVGDVLSSGSPALSSRFIHIPPLQGPGGAQNATVQTALPTPGGVIPATCRDPQAVLGLMDVMLGEEAYLVAAFGEQGVDWDYASLGDIGYDGKAALVTVTSQEWDRAPARNFAQAGPFVSHLRLADGVAWNGYQADQRYLDARAARVYKSYEPAEYIRVPLPESGTRLEQVRAQVRQAMEAFITGDEDPADEAAWQRYLDSLAPLGLQELLEAAQAYYRQY